MSALLSLLREFRVAILVVVGGAILSFLVFGVLRRRETADRHSEFERRSQERLLALQDQLAEDLSVLSFLRSFYLSSQNVERDEFRAFVTPALSANREFKSLEWLPRVVAAERKSFEEARRKDSQADFRISELTREGEAVPAGERVEYFPIYYVEPFAPNRETAGLDLASDAVNREAIDRARTENIPVATGPLRPLGEEKVGPAFRVFMPVYRSNATPQEGERSVVGFYAIEIGISELVEDSLAPLRPAGIDFVLYDDEAPPSRRLLYAQRSRTRGSSSQAVLADPTLRWQGTIDVATRKWSIESSAGPDFFATGATSSSAWALIVGLLFTALIGLSLYNAIGRSRAVERLVVERTRELSREVAEHQQTAKALEKALRKAEESDRLKRSFLDNISHEIRTPLNVITGFNQLIADRFEELGDRSQQELLDAVSRASQRLIDTVHATLDLSRIETGEFRLRPARLDLPAVIEAHVRNIEPEARRKGLVLSCEIRERQAAVRFDPYCFSQALTNLLDNAIKFTERGTVSVRLLRDAGGELCLEVKDSGVGIHPDYIPRLFQPFSQEDSSNTRGFEGPGIGLALVRRHLELNGARISAESEKGKGSVFRVYFSTSSELPQREATG
jgi:signal transduction histidine kinase